MKPMTKIASVILALVALLHLARVLFKTNVLIDTFELPLWVSMLGFTVASLLSFGLWRESKQLN
jgi:membrane protein implicated in regulation of membrane protease activity